MTDRENRIVITGGPGTGKTSLLTKLVSADMRLMPDTGCEIMRGRHQQGLTARPDPEQFGWDMLKADIKNYRLADELTGIVFFDRSILDSMCYLDELSELGGDVRRSCLESYPYRRRVFILPPWQVIHTTDETRDDSFQECVEVDRAIRDWYESAEYELVEVPTLSVAERCEFVMAHL